MDNRTFVLTLVAMPLCLAIPSGVWYTAMGLEEGASDRLGAGLPIITLGLLALRYQTTVQAVLRAESPQSAAAVGLLDLALIVLLQVVTVGQFFLMLDGHVHFRACCCLFFLYLVGAGVVLVVQRGRPSGWGMSYLRLAWVPILAFGVPLMLPKLKELGLVPFSPIHW